MMTARARITLRPAVPGWRNFDCNGVDKSQRTTAAATSGRKPSENMQASSSSEI